MQIEPDHPSAEEHQQKEQRAECMSAIDVWQHLGLPERPPLATLEVCFRLKCDDVKSLQRELEDFSVGVRLRTILMTEVPQAILDMYDVSTDVPMTFNDNDPSPPLDYRHIFDFTGGLRDSPELQAVCEKLQFREWYQAALLVSHFRLLFHNQVEEMLEEWEETNFFECLE